MPSSRPAAGSRRRYDVASVCVRPADVARARRRSSMARTWRSGRPSASRTATIGPRRRCSSRVRALGRRRDRARHGPPDRRAQVRSRRGCPGGHRGGRRTSPMPRGAIVKVIFENAYLTDDEKIRACRLTEAAGGDFVKTSTGFAPTGATHDDLRLMRAHTSPHVQVKAAGGVRTLDALLEVMALGVTRVGATATATILDDFRARKAGRLQAATCERRAADAAESRARHHLGIDLGVTNLKWAVVEETAARGGRSIAARSDPRRRGPDAVIGRIAVTAARGARALAGRRLARRRGPGPVRPGARRDAVPRRTCPATGWAGRSRAPVEAAIGLPSSLINDARAFGVAELRLGAGRGASVDGRADPRDRRRWGHRHRWPGPSRARRDGR